MNIILFAVTAAWEQKRDIGKAEVSERLMGCITCMQEDIIP